MNDDGLPGLGHGAGDTFPQLEAHAFQKLLLHAHGDGKINCWVWESSSSSDQLRPG